MGKKTVQTIEDIARLADVSKSTVSRALNDSPLIGVETKERIRSIAREHNFEIHVAARRLSTKESYTIAFVTHAYEAEFSVADLFGLEMLGAISNALAAKHYDLLMAHVDPYDKTWPHQYLDTGRADGFILMTSSRKQYHIKSLLDTQAPFIVWGAPLPPHQYCSVTGDNFTGGRLATEHLINSGRKKIAFLGGPADELEVQRRYEGYESALAAAGRQIEPALIVHADFTSASARTCMQTLLDQAPDLDAVFVNSDVMAVAGMDVIHESGRRVPEDVAVIGYDNLSIAALSQPPLTTISQNIPTVGRLLAENLIQYLQKGIVTNVTVPVDLVIRKSCC
jgi:DNA-binding LacI/PurR family transcriptional regulator